MWNWELQLATDHLTAEETAIFAEAVQRIRQEIGNATADTGDTGKGAHSDTITVSCRCMLAERRCLTAELTEDALRATRAVLMTWLDDHPKDRTALSGYVAGTTATERMQLTPHARTLYVVEGGLIGLVRRNGHAHGLHWVQSRQAIRVTLQKNRVP